MSLVFDAPLKSTPLLFTTMDGGGYFIIKITLTMEKCDEFPGLCIANDGRWKKRNTQGIIPLHHLDENIPLSEMAKKITGNKSYAPIRFGSVLADPLIPNK